MQIKTKEISDKNSLLSHMILNCLDLSTIKKHVVTREVRNSETEYDIKLLFEGDELDIRKFFEVLDSDWEGAVKKAAALYAEELFEERKHTFMSKNSDNAKLESISRQLDKVTNQLENIKSAFSNIAPNK